MSRFGRCCYCNSSGQAQNYHSPTPKVGISLTQEKVQRGEEEQGKKDTSKVLKKSTEVAAHEKISKGNPLFRSPTSITAALGESGWRRQENVGGASRPPMMGDLEGIHKDRSNICVLSPENSRGGGKKKTRKKSKKKTRKKSKKKTRKKRSKKN